MIEDIHRWGDGDAAFQLDRKSTVVEFEVSQSVVEALGEGSGFGGGRVGGQDNEGVAAEAAGGVFGAADFRQYAGDLLENAIAEGGALRVVDILEIVDVNDDDGEV